MTNFNQQLEKIKSTIGFIAALDQSGGSTPKALANYGVDATAYKDEAEMYDVIHNMRSRIVTSPGFNGERIMGAILFERTMDSEIKGQGTAEFLWEKKSVVPFLKIDKGLSDEENGVQLMKPMPELDALLKKAKDKGVFGTKMRSVIKTANQSGIDAIVAQQFEVGLKILAAGLIPIIEPEVDINSPQKVEVEVILLQSLMTQLNKLSPDQQVILKLTLPETDNFYKSCVAHPSVLKVVALSGGYPREEANRRLDLNNGMVASFSRALTEGLSAQQSDDEFNKMLDQSIESIYSASKS